MNLLQYHANFWSSNEDNDPHDNEEFKNFVALAKYLGFSYTEIYATLFAAEQFSLENQELSTAFFVLVLLSSDNSGHFFINHGQILPLLAQFDQLMLDRIALLKQQNQETKPLNQLRSFLKAQIAQFSDCYAQILANNKLVALAENLDTKAQVLVINQHGNLYFSKIYFLEQYIASLVMNQLTKKPVIKLSAAQKEVIFSHVVASVPYFADEVKQAVTILLEQAFLLLTGGPGSGKTTALKAILEAVYCQAAQEDSLENLRIVLCAPTGRATSHMAKIFQQTHLTSFISSATTLQRLLGYNGRTGKCYYNAENLLKASVVAIDEASMIDAYMFRNLLEALPYDAKLIFIGDANQLPSIELGAIFADLVTFFEGSMANLPSPVVRLTKCYRSNFTIQNLANATLQASLAQFKAILSSEDANLVALNLEQEDRWQVLHQIKDRYLSLREEHSRDHHQLWQAFQNFSVLSPRNSHSIFSCSYINNFLDSAIGAKAKYYHGKPIIVTKNDHDTGLSNGDRGIIVQKNSHFYAYFGDEKLLELALLPSWQSAYSITIHKSQGSEYEEIIFLLPLEAKRLLSKQLLYTALTRAKEKITLYYYDDVIDEALQKDAQRRSSLAAILADNCAL